MIEGQVVFKTCVVCGKEFQATSPRQRACGAACRKELSRRAQKKYLDRIKEEKSEKRKKKYFEEQQARLDAAFKEEAEKSWKRQAEILMVKRKKPYIKSATSAIEWVREEMCTDYCKFGDICMAELDAEKLNKICNICPLNYL